VYRLFVLLILNWMTVQMGYSAKTFFTETSEKTPLKKTEAGTTFG
jgi:hypothetical protein